MFDALMDQTASVFRAVDAKDALGGTTRTYPATATLSNIQCAIQPASARQVDLWQRRNIVVDTMIYCVADLDALLSGGLRLTDKFVDANGGINYVVKGFTKQLNTMISDEPLYQITCQRIIS